MGRPAGRSGARGSALFLILVAVALFAAISYAITSSGRAGGNVANEQALISAGQLTQYPASVRAAVTRMLLTGTVETSVDFTENTAGGVPEAAVFNPAGGNVIWQDPPGNIGTATDWGWKPKLSGNKGWFISGIGSNANSGKDSFGYLDGVSLAICQQLLRGMGLPLTPLNETVTIDFSGTGGAAGSNGNAASAFAFFAWNATPQPFACTRNNGGNYIYYHAIIEK